MKEFRIYDREDGKVYDGWKSTNILEKNVIQTIKDSMVAGVGDKVGTSIPTALARLFLFDHALGMVRDQQEGITTSHELVSHFWDLLELIFGRPGQLDFKWWDYKMELSKLEASPCSNHQSLMKSLSNAWKELSQAAGLGDGALLPGLHLIYYEGVLLGGTSPLTLVFTSPNLVAGLKASGKVLLGVGGNRLFYEAQGNYVPRALHERNAQFREFMLQYRLQYAQELHAYCHALDEYLDVNNRNHNPSVNLSDPQFDDKYPVVNSGGANVIIQNLPIRTKNGNTLAMEPSEFMMKPSVHYFKKMVYNGQNIKVETPLVLVPGAHRLAYWGTAPWNVAYGDQLSNIRHVNLWDRKIPGIQARYPFVTVSDFLEDKMIQMSFIVNREKFFTGTDQDFNCLLPIRKEYFNFFTLEDLRQQLQIRRDKESGAITVRLEVPVTGNAQVKYILMERVYSGGDIVKCSNLNTSFNFGIFPFYQTNRAGVDKYCVLFGDYTHKMGIQFYRFENIALNVPTAPSLTKSGAGGCLIETKVPGEVVKERSERRYIHLEGLDDNRFDCICLDNGGVSGLVIPKFEKVDLDRAAIDFVFSIDFGTSNTHVAYNMDRGDVKAFDISDQDQQMVLFNKLDEGAVGGGFGVYATFKDESKREFPPMRIGNGEAVCFPLRTAVFETMDLAGQQGDLFGNVNVAFSLKMDNNEGQNPPQKFVTELKWAVADVLQERRISAFFKEIVWMIKNKILLKQGKLNTTIIWTRPEAMMGLTKNFFHCHWESAIDEVFGKGHGVSLVEQSESVAPYFSFVQEVGMLNSQSYLNIDIGGGTSDFIYLKPTRLNERRAAFSSSVFFAANDLWGGGTQEPSLKFNQNGFFSLAKECYASPSVALSEEVRKCFEFYLDSNIHTKFTSSDVISFVFAHDREFQFSPAIQGNKRLFSLIFVHYAALMYYVAQFVKKYSLPVPVTISFTGMGSLYIRLISSNQNMVTKLTQLLLSKFLGQEVEIPPSFNVQFSNAPKEITAMGAVYGVADDSVDERSAIHFGVKAETEDQQGYCIQDINNSNLKESVLNNYSDFLDILTEDKDIVRYLRQEYDLTFDPQQVAKMRQMGEVSFDQVYAQFKSPTDPIPYSMFFWTLKETLYRVSINQTTEE